MQHAEGRTDAAGAREVVHEVRTGRIERAERRHAAAAGVEVGEVQRHAGFPCRGEQVQHGVGRTAERHVHRHGVQERRAGGDRARSQILLDQTHDRRSGAGDQGVASFGQRRLGAVARQGETQGLEQAVHRVGGEQTRARAAARTGMGLDGVELGARDAPGFDYPPLFEQEALLRADF